jgi:hypothetical protein
MSAYNEGLKAGTDKFVSLSIQAMKTNMDSNPTKLIPVLLSHVLLFVVQHKN